MKTSDQASEETTAWYCASGTVMSVRGNRQSSREGSKMMAPIPTAASRQRSPSAKAMARAVGETVFSARNWDSAARPLPARRTNPMAATMRILDGNRKRFMSGTWSRRKP